MSWGEWGHEVAVWLIFWSGRIAEKGVLSLRGGAGQEVAEKIEDGTLLEFCGLGQAGENADVPGAFLTSG